ncbi:hypothetical protein [Priestia abyssalis]|uniref:hypothetical protein n=1 Tax=Priestia abyssalis TaxID=1221450 RepID=UPI0009958CCB|nr:hypothetical protein [Priestia abyssalis]
MDNRYSNRYFKKQAEVNEIWRRFMDKQDVLDAIERVRGSIAYMSKHLPHKLNKEDMEFMERPLGELEIAIRKIKNIPELFGFNELEIKEIHEAYEDLRKKVEQIDLQRISWN